MNIIEVGTIFMFFVAFFGLITCRKMIKSIILTVLLESSVIMFFLSIGFTNRIIPPIGSEFADLYQFADPLPQALMITAIIIGAAVTTIKVTMLMTFFRKYRTTDWEEARKISRANMEAIKMKEMDMEGEETC